MSKEKLNLAVSEADVERKAAGMIRAFRSDAAAECKIQVQKMLRSSQPSGVEVWTRILAAVEKSQVLPA